MELTVFALIKCKAKYKECLAETINGHNEGIRSAHPVWGIYDIVVHLEGNANTLKHAIQFIEQQPDVESITILPGVFR